MFMMHCSFPSTFLQGVNADDAVLVFRLAALAKAVDFSFRLTGRPFLDAATSEAWQATFDRLVYVPSDTLYNSYGNMALAVACASFRVSGTLPRKLSGLRRDVDIAKSKGYTGQLPEDQGRLSADFAIPAAIACGACARAGVVCMVGWVRRSCLRCTEKDRRCVFGTVRLRFSPWPLLSDLMTSRSRCRLFGAGGRVSVCARR